MARRDRDLYYRSLALSRQIESFRDGHGKLQSLDAIISRKDIAISAKLEAIDIALSKGIVTEEQLSDLPPRPQPKNFGASMNADPNRTSKFDNKTLNFAVLVGWVISTLFSIWYLYDKPEDLGLALSVGLLFGGLPFFAFCLAAAVITGIGGYLANRLVPSRIAKRRFAEALQSYSTLALVREIKAYEKDVALYKKASGPEFERLVARAYSKSGYDVIEVGGANDGGVDLIVRKAGIKAIIQCKAHARAIPPSAVRELYGTLGHDDASIAILASTNGPSDNAREWAKGKNIRFVSPDDLILGRL